MRTNKSVTALAAIAAIVFLVAYFLSTLVFSDMMTALWAGLAAAGAVTLYLLVAGPVPLRRWRV